MMVPALVMSLRRFLNVRRCFRSVFLWAAVFVGLFVLKSLLDSVSSSRCVLSTGMCGTVYLFDQPAEHQAAP
jgi:hypothetical protein